MGDDEERTSAKAIFPTFSSPSMGERVSLSSSRSQRSIMPGDEGGEGDEMRRKDSQRRCENHRIEEGRDVDQKKHPPQWDDGRLCV